MKVKLTAIGIATAAGLTVFGSVAAPAFAANDAPSAAPVAVAEERGCVFRYDRPFSWSQLGIVDDAARVIGMPKWEVCERLEDGRSLLEIANNHGVGENELKFGILGGQWTDLMRRVSEGRMSYAEALRDYNQLVEHIDAIIHHHR